jgi:hypothetical protein
MDPAAQARDQRCVSRGIYEILESLTCGGFPIRSARESAPAVNRIRVRTLCGYFSKYVTVIQKGNIKRLRYEIKDGKRSPFGLCIGNSVSVFTDDPGFWQCEASGAEANAEAYRLWETRVTKSSSNCGSQSQNVFPAQSV